MVTSNNQNANGKTLLQSKEQNPQQAGQGNQGGYKSPGQQHDYDKNTNRNQPGQREPNKTGQQNPKERDPHKMGQSNPMNKDDYRSK